MGINLEDSDTTSGELIPVGEAASRIRLALATARNAGLEDFVVNARSDAFFRGGTLDESISRGKAYLEAGATTVYILWPAGRLHREEDVTRVVRELGGW